MGRGGESGGEWAQRGVAACAKPESMREPSTSPNDLARACQTFASDQMSTVLVSSPRGSTKSTTLPPTRDVKAKKTENPTEARTPYCAGSKPTSRFMKSRVVSSVAGCAQSNIPPVADSKARHMGLRAQVEAQLECSSYTHALHGDST